MERTLSLTLLILGISLTSSIKTIHHDKPESVTISTVKAVTTDRSISSTAVIVTNVTLTSAERKKRLLPYQNFYFNQPYNRPHQAGVSSQQYKDYEDPEQVNRKPEYDHVNIRAKDVLYQPGQKFTPFLESNALPGHFRPMVIGNGNPQKMQYTYLNAPSSTQDEKFSLSKEHFPTDFGVIYDQLSQLKLRQQEMHKAPYGYRLVTQHKVRERPQKQEYRPTIFESPTRFKINPSKTTIETFTATNIDIPDPIEEEKYEYQPLRHHQVPTPTKEQFSIPVQTYYKENTKPYIRHQFAIEIPQSSLPLTFSPSLVRKPYGGKEGPRKPYIFIQQGNPDAKQPVLIVRKPKPSVVIDENFVAEKYLSQVPAKSHHYQHRPIYASEEPKYSPAVYNNNFNTQYQVTVPPIELNEQEYQPIRVPSSYDQLEYGAKLNPEPEKAEYIPQKVEYTPQKVEYTPPKKEYTPQNVEYTPPKVEYTAQQVQYVPQKVNYDPQKGAYEPHKVEYQAVLATSTPHYEDDNKYYHYPTVTPGPVSSVTSASVHDAVRGDQKVVPQYQELPKPHEEVVYRVKPQSPKLETLGGNTNSLSEILKQLQESNTLPQTLTPDNVDNSIRTLVKILNALRDRQKQHKPAVAQEQYDYENEAGVDLDVDLFDTPNGGTPGTAGVDYPALSTIPKTNFNCKTQRYKGFFGDPDTNCQVWHYCDLNGGQASFLCPNGTIFSQVALTCDWWYNVKCSSTAQLYVLNERLYKFIIPLSPKFPEDYSGPLVDKYLAMKFQEMEEKLRKQKKGKGNSDSKESEEDSENSDSEEAEEDSDSSKEESETVEESEKTTTEESDKDVNEAKNPV